MTQLPDTSALFSTLAAGSGGKLDPESHVLPHYLFGFFTNHHLMSLLAVGIGIFLLSMVAKKISAGSASGAKDAESFVTKGSVAQLFETICVFLRDEVTRPLLGDLTDKYIPLIWSIFFFVLFGNLLGMIPIGPLFGIVGGSSHLGGTFTGNLNFTAGLAIVMYFVMMVSGIKESGLDFFKHMWVVPLKPVWLSPLMIVVGIFIFLLELLLSPLIRAFALCIRLFANMVAGHLVLGSLIIMAVTAGGVGTGVTVLGAAIFSFLELFVSFLQAYIFTFLTVLFISLGVVSHDDHDEHHGGLDEGAMPHDSAQEGFSGTATSGTTAS